MASMTRATRLGLVVALATCSAFAADKQKEFRYNAGPGASLTVVNEFGSVTVRPGAGRQVVIAATLHSDKVEVDSSQKGNRIEVHSRLLASPKSDDARVDYEIRVPADIMLSVRADDGPIRVEGVRGDLTLEGDAAEVTVQDCGNGHVHVRTVKGPIHLSNISNGHVEVTSVGGDVALNAVTGPKVTVSTTKGNIRYSGDFAGGGDFILNSHSGDIEVTLPTSASVDLSARSISGSVQQDFPLQQKTHTSFQPTPGRSFAGTSNTGASSVQLRSFSGKIRVKKQ